MLTQCPACDQTTGLEIISRPDEFKIKGESITIDVQLYHCKVCGSEFSAKELGDPFRKAYDEYRKQKGMVQPEQIVEFRKKYDLSQKELSTLLGFGDVTLSRYENGSLQDQVHDNILKLAMDPKNFLQLLEQNRTLFSEKKLIRLLTKLNSELSFIENLDRFINGSHPNEFNGNTKIDLEKITEVIELLCFNREVFKTKLMKLLFYVDFLNYKNHHHSITGMSYAHLPYGPVPHGYELILGTITANSAEISLEPAEIGNCIGEIVRINNVPKIHHLSETDLEVIHLISNRFEYYSSKTISELSHAEPAYKKTEATKLISYKLAPTLNIE